MSGLLNDTEILAAVKANPAFIVPFDPVAVQPASYDMALGEAYHAVPDASGRTRKWAPVGLKAQKWVTIPPFHSALFESREVVDVPGDLVGHIWLDYEWMAKGIVYSGGAIDPTYRGKIWIPVHNVGPKTVEIGYDDKLISIEWVRLGSPTSFPAPYGKTPLLTLADLPSSKIPTPPEQDLKAWNELSQSIDELETSLKELHAAVDSVQSDVGRSGILVGLILTVATLALTVAVAVWVTLR